MYILWYEHVSRGCVCPALAVSELLTILKMDDREEVEPNVTAKTKVMTSVKYRTTKIRLFSSCHLKITKFEIQYVLHFCDHEEMEPIVMNNGK